MHSESTSTIYVLRSHDDKYYVGRSTAPQSRILQHFREGGSAWTRMHPPAEVVKILPNSSRFDEDKVTKEYMDAYGIDNVRGGSYCRVELPETDYEMLKKELRTANGLCTRCGRSGHYRAQCFARSEVPVPVQASVPAADTCFKCGQVGHWARDCGYFPAPSYVQQSYSNSM